MKPYTNPDKHEAVNENATFYRKLKIERKIDWAQGTTTAPLYFVHGTIVVPRDVQKKGLSPKYSREYVVDSRTRQPIAGGRVIFAFQVCQGMGLPANAEKVGAAAFLWNVTDSHNYVFKVPIGITYWSQKGQLTHGLEVAFPYVIESEDIVEYWEPSPQTWRGAFNKSKRTQFQKLKWAG